MRITRVVAAAATAVAAFGLTIVSGSAANAANWRTDCSSFPYSQNYLQTRACLWHDNSTYRVGSIIDSSWQTTPWQLNGGDYYLVLQSDGNLVEYHTHVEDPSTDASNYYIVVDRVVAATNRFAPAGAGWLAMQADGNLVAYDANGNYYWSTGTNGQLNSTATLRIDSNGRVHVTDGVRDVNVFG